MRISILAVSNMSKTTTIDMTPSIALAEVSCPRTDWATMTSWEVSRTLVTCLSTADWSTPMLLSWVSACFQIAWNLGAYCGRVSTSWATATARAANSRTTKAKMSAIAAVAATTRGTRWRVIHDTIGRTVTTRVRAKKAGAKRSWMR